MRSRYFSTIAPLQPGGGVFAVVRLVEHEGGQAILKDFSRSSRLFRSTFGAYLIGREAQAYGRLAGVAGIPRLIDRIRPDGLLLSHVAGPNCLSAPPEKFTQDFFDGALGILAKVRARGVLHCDVGGNLVLGSDGRPWLVDFGSSIVLPTWIGPLGSYLTSLREKYDERALLKLKRRRAPHLLSTSEDERSRVRLPFERWVGVGERVLRRTIGWMSG
ncbi:MAG: hypothetical protein EHM61_12805 [Acidobacteria bacterium]|nr:MAG: hypothetical protein EHM61_12805 [Acidobacteriota bacterium]